MSSGDAQIHESAWVEDGSEIGSGTRIWHGSQVRAGARIGGDCVLGKSVFVDRGVRVGDRCKIQNFVSIYSGVTLEDDVFVGPSATFTNDLVPRAWNTTWTVTPTRVGTGASIGANATILCGIEIGPHAIVGAGAVVTEDVPANALVAGVPARNIGWVCRCGARLQIEPTARPVESCEACAPSGGRV